MNGYDEEAVPRSRHGGRFTIAYAGTIYLDRDPRPLFRAVAEVVRCLGFGPEALGVELMGEVKSHDGIPIEAIAREAGIEAFVRTRPPRPRRAVMEFLADATLLLSLPQDSDMAIPSKIFEYMAFDAWILALASPESATELLLRHTSADVVSPDDVHAVAKVLQCRYQQYRQGQRPSRLAQNSTAGASRQSSSSTRSRDASTPILRTLKTSSGRRVTLSVCRDDTLASIERRSSRMPRPRVRRRDMVWPARSRAIARRRGFSSCRAVPKGLMPTSIVKHRPIECAI